ncbi:MAG: EF-hand domain-containing protein [Acidovorax sp.]|nr:MAG: EF-hand domain-containing protein [Acidovorax sp.]
MRDFKMLDFDGDGKLSRSEVKLFPRLAAAFEDADTDRDGYVSYEEVRVFAGKYRAERDRNKAAQAAAAKP